MYCAIVNNITKKYGDSKVLNNISFHLEEGKIYGLLGKNGVGKTTLLKIIVQLTPLEMYEKKIKIIKLQTKIAALISNPSCYMNLNVEDNLKLFSMLYYKNNHERKNIVRKTIIDFKLETMTRKKTKELSLGMLQKLKLAMTFMSDADLLVLDEPFNGLDIESSLLLKEKINEAKKLKKTIVITSHNTEQLEKICDKFMILHNTNLISIDNDKLVNSNLEKLYCDILDGGKK